MLSGYPFYAPECPWMLLWCLETAFGSGFLLASAGFFRFEMYFFVRINLKYAVLTIANDASRSAVFARLNIVPKRWEKVKFQAVQHLLRWLFEFWSASAFCLQILLHLAPAPFFHFWIVFSVEISSMFQNRFGQNLCFSYSIISFDEGSGLSKEIGGRSTKNLKFRAFWLELWAF